MSRSRQDSTETTEQTVDRKQVERRAAALNVEINEVSETQVAALGSGFKLRRKGVTVAVVETLKKADDWLARHEQELS